MARYDKDFRESLRGKTIPVLTLDNRWHQVFDKLDATGEVSKLESKLNDLLKEQGKYNTTYRDVKKLKAKLMKEIIPLANELNADPENKKTEKKLNETKRLIEDCSEKIEDLEDVLHELPSKIQETNLNLMITTMEICYDVIEKNQKDIKEISAWIDMVRVQLKKNLIRKQEREESNKEIYAYMHDIFGAQVMELFDLKKSE